MKHPTSIISLFIGISILFAGNVYSQPPDETNTHKENRIDSLEVVNLDETQIQIARLEFKTARAQVNRKEVNPKSKEIKQEERVANKDAREFRRTARLKKSNNKSVSSK